MSCSGGWRQQSAHHPEGGGFACTVGTQQAEDLAPPNREGGAVGGGEVAKLARQVLRLDHDFRITRGPVKALSKGRFGVRHAAKFADERILEARLHWNQFSVSAA